MATSSIFGAFGPLRKSIGSVTYSTLATARDGKRKQVARQKPTSVKNPNTVAQIMQRMKLTPAQRFYDAFEKVVAKGIMSHSWEGVSYGNASRQEFMSRAMKNDAAVYVPKGYNAFAPGEYEVSAGSLPVFNGWRNDLVDAEGQGQILDISSPIDARMLQIFEEIGYQAGDQLTIIGAKYRSAVGQHEPFAVRCVMNVGALPESFGAVPAELYLYADGVAYEGDVSAFAIIVSRGLDSDAKRSSATMLLTEKYKSLVSAEAMNAAIASYQDGTTYNSLGSDWFLNQGTAAGQAVNGRVSTLEITAVGDGDISRQATFLVVERVSNGQIGYSVVTDGGTGQQEAVAVLSGGQLARIRFNDADSESAFVLGENVARGLVNAGGISLGYVNYTPELAVQGGFTYQEF